MQKKFLKIVSFTMAMLMMFQTPITLLADSKVVDSIGSINMEDDGVNVGVDKTQEQKTTYSEEITNESLETSDNKTLVYVSQASSFGVFIPKVIVLSGQDKNANYLVNVNGNIGGEDTINVVPEETFTLSQFGKNDIVANISQDKVSWLFNELDIDGNGSIVANNMTAGSWSGKFNFNISLDNYVPEKSGLSLSTEEVIIGVDGSKQVNAYIDGELANDSVTWESDNENISVENGFVETKASAKVGDVATVTVKSNSPSTQVAKNSLIDVLTLTNNVMAAEDDEIQFTVTIVDIEYEIEYLDIVPGNEAIVTAKILPEGIEGIVSWSRTAVAGMNLVKNGNELTIKIAEDMEVGQTYNIIATFGDFSKELPINIVSGEQDILLEPGLYDENNVMLCSWEDSGIDVEIEYNYTSHKTATTSPYYVVTNNYPTTTKIVLPNSVTKIGGHTFRDCTFLTNIKIPDSVTSIGVYAFQDCVNLLSITIPNGVTSIQSTFFNCQKLKNVNLGNGITNIGEQTFYNCENLTNITIPNSVTTIGDSAFSNCSSITNIKIPNSVTSIGKSAFLGCMGLTNVTIPNSITKLEYRTFYNCTGLTNVIIPDSVINIVGGTFTNCTNLTSIYIPESVLSIGDAYESNSPFYGCSPTLRIYCGANSRQSKWGDYNYYNSSDTLVTIFGVTRNDYTLLCDYTNDMTTYTIPKGITKIPTNMFYNSTNLTTIEIPNSVTNICEYAFYGCTNLTTIEIPNSITNIGAYAFYNCSNLVSLEIPDSVVSIGTMAFKNCTNLNNIKLSKNITIIEPYTFSKCSNLVSLEIPEGVITINDTFSSCTNLTSIYIPSSVTSIVSNAFCSSSHLTTIIVDENNLIYDSRNNCNAIIKTSTNTLIRGCQSTIIPEDITTIEGNAFANCVGLTNIEIPYNITSIGKSAFANCTNLTSVTFKNTTTWYVGTSKGATTTKISVTNATTNAQNFLDTHRFKYWTKK